MYVKLFSSILDSSVWDQPDNVRLVWITMLAMADQDGQVHASVGSIAARARVSLEAAKLALDILLSPDPDSRSVENEGRRIERVGGSYQLLNYDKYRKLKKADDRRAANRDAQKRWREKQRNANRNQM